MISNDQYRHRTIQIYTIPFIAFAFYCEPSLGGAINEVSSSRVVKLNNWAIILPTLESVKESWGEDVELWNPSIEQVEAADKRILAHIKEDARRGVKIDPSKTFVIQYFGVRLNKRQLIICLGWETGALLDRLREEYGKTSIDMMLSRLTQSAYLVFLEDTPNGPVVNFEFQYDPVADELDGEDKKATLAAHYDNEKCKEIYPNGRNITFLCSKNCRRNSRGFSRYACRHYR